MCINVMCLKQCNYEKLSSMNQKETGKWSVHLKTVGQCDSHTKGSNRIAT